MDILTEFLNNISYKFPKGYPDMNNAADVIILESEFNQLGINIHDYKFPPRDLNISIQESIEPDSTEIIE
jgi:hypothetical protein